MLTEVEFLSKSQAEQLVVGSDVLFVSSRPCKTTATQTGRGNSLNL